jgi:hypothetical protein
MDYVHSFAHIFNTWVMVFANPKALDEINNEIAAQEYSFQANYERRLQEWQLQEALAQQDYEIGQQQIQLADDNLAIVTQEKAVAEMVSGHAKDTLEFLNGKFTSRELYDWMSGVLESVYRFFLQQATTLAKLAENQLAFERQEAVPAFIKSNYWAGPPKSTVGADGQDNATDRKGLTGSARLLQDAYQLDQYAFDTNKRKLQLTKTLSLARIVPVEFHRFLETGVLTFSTPAELFDRDFPGQYLRLIKRVRTSVIALVPPTRGICATLSASGLSRVVIGPDIFQTVTIRREPEFVALTSPANATGLFEMETAPSEMLLPFEGNGVDTTWEFRMPKSANQFNYGTIADVLISIDYTALHSFEYGQQVIEGLSPNLSADRTFSFRNQFADQWYDLHNPEQTSSPMTVRFATTREDFPPNIEALKLQHVALFFMRADGKSFEIPVAHLLYFARGDAGSVGGVATTIDGIISTRRGNAANWTAITGKTPVGEWEMALPNTKEIKDRFLNEEIRDILLIVTYSGRTPPWPT